MRNLILIVVFLLTTITQAQIAERYKYAVTTDENNELVAEGERETYIKIDFDESVVILDTEDYRIKYYEMYQTYLVMYVDGGIVIYYRDIGFCQIVTDSGNTLNLINFNRFNYQELPLGKEKLIESGKLW